LTGSTGANVLIGGAGNDSPPGGAGIDQLFGEAGNDNLTSDSADSVVNGGGDLDTVTVPAGTGNVMLDLAAGLIETVTAAASTGNNVFNATWATWAVTITDGTGNDTIEGGLGNDVLNGGAGNDWVNYEHASAGGVTVNLTLKKATGAAGTDSVTLFENIISGGGVDKILNSSRVLHPVCVHPKRRRRLSGSLPRNRREFPSVRHCGGGAGAEFDQHRRLRCTHSTGGILGIRLRRDSLPG